MRYSALSMVLTILLTTGCGSGSSGTSKTPQPTPPSSSKSSSSVLSSSESSVSSSSLSSSSLSSSLSSASSSVVAGQVCGVNNPSAPQDINQLPTVKCIVVDQFGYLPKANKVAVLRNPKQGFDSDLSYIPSAQLVLINALDGSEVMAAAPKQWNNGATHVASGDQIWWFDFSTVITSGSYFVLDRAQAVRSAEFKIDANIYRPVLQQAMRTFFYQRAGFAKQAPYAEPGWVDGASHVGPGQDKQARLYSAKNGTTTERDLSGGWYDAGDYNKYTNWHADYLRELLHAYITKPQIWTDDFNILESGNGLPDIIDEVKWGMDWLMKMQHNDGSVLSVQGLDHKSPPSTASGPSVYGPSTTAASLSAAAAFAFGAKVFDELNRPELKDYADELLQRSERAWEWAAENPQKVFYNAGKVAAGEQEVDDAGRAEKKRLAAIYLYAASNKIVYREYVDTHTTSINWASPWNQRSMYASLYYASLPGATKSVANSITTSYKNAMNGADNWPAITNDSGPYHAYLEAKDFTWGSNRTMAQKGMTFYNFVTFNLFDNDKSKSEQAALGYINYLHGVNPLGKVYLSNMGKFGAEDSVDSFYHSWFSDGSIDWDSVSGSNYGPAPGFLVGGPNPSYSWDACCPNSCGGPAQNAACGMAPLAPPAGQPAAKSYRDFNTSWPVNSWAVTENHNDYQVAYIHLLSKFVE